MQPPPWSAGLAARSVWSSAASLVRRCEGHACRGLDQQSRLSSFATIQLSTFPLAPFPAHPFPDVLCAIQQLDAVCFTCDCWATVSDCRSCAQVALARRVQLIGGGWGAGCRASFFHRREDGSPLGLQQHHDEPGRLRVAVLAPPDVDIGRTLVERLPCL